MQESLTLSNSSTLPAARPLQQVEEPPLSAVEADVQAMRLLVQNQQSQLQSLQALKQAKPLVGITTDSSWGMALEGLVLGLVALALGAFFLWGARAPFSGRTASRRASGVRPAPPAEFSDSMLYLADNDGAQDSMPAVTTHLHDPLQDAKASTLAHEDGDPELEYHRMALMAQGLSVTAGAGHVDSDRVPLESVPSPVAEERGGQSLFSPVLSQAEFDQRAATEEVERVRRYLAQRRADRAKTALPFETVVAPAPEQAAPPEEPVANLAPMVDIPLEVALLPVAPAVTVPVAPPDALEHMDLSAGASLLVALDGVVPGAAQNAATQVPVPEDVLLERAPQALTDSVARQETVSGDAADAAPMPTGHIQLALAQEFRDLGLWEESRARLLEILEQPDAGQHAQARVLLEALALTAPASLDLQQDKKDPWH